MTKLQYHVEPKGRWLESVQHRFCSFHGVRPKPISMVVIHNISLPSGLFGAPYIDQLFLGCVQSDYEVLKQLHQVEVSAHLLIRRNGGVVQYVPFDRRAWHAGVSCFANEANCNDYSIGIELEGADNIPYSDNQYQSLAAVISAIMAVYPLITPARIVGHSDIAPGRKTDPGPAFDWQRLTTELESIRL
ncbi:1,6-anhydro-N-acetylmuramyl-L-alanine amidase AmpD [Ferrimonas lipolytica]|uniref:1,6-anhydro-N-acetylmuramyl-L-alanine amidase AmpD n=1 Tax=Ferrimonas lipolytica TaxID=2724191 RepID=A0A6H1UJR3_9GAMM|nr:1,6-anhydro-N-acetylmuramyl-L-alanine amidase AmpD [Ferrimonas lipolytica]QIZ78553.1 1,6-anhydro-N-acetylmuramyl-L-alanine amidase AmpD [Ferrimonas lipolytica]